MAASLLGASKPEEVIENARGQSNLSKKEGNHFHRGEKEITTVGDAIPDAASKNGELPAQPNSSKRICLSSLMER